MAARGAYGNASDGQGPRFVVTAGPTAGTTITRGAGAQLIGRHPAADISLDDITVSLRHALVAWHGCSVVITDLGSLNGTFVNGQRVDSAVLHPGDELSIGRSRMSLMAPSATTAA